MQSPQITTETLPPLPGIFASLRTGFDSIAGHLQVILVPVVFDLFLWLGPHLSIVQISLPVLNGIASFPTGNGVSQDDINNVLKMYRQFLQEFNLIGILRTFPIGVFSLMRGEMPSLSPLGAPAIIQISSPGQLLLAIFLLIVAGWILGALYFRSVAALVTPELLPDRVRAILQTFLYSVIWSLILFIIGLPVFFMVYLLFLINNLIGQVVIVLLGFFSMWLIVPVFFSPLGIFVKKQNALASILGSFQMMRFTLPASSLFVLVVFLIGVGLNFLWAIPLGDSWLVLIGILGHAFITTALLASAFAYYHEITAWLQTVLGRLKAVVPTQPA